MPVFERVASASSRPRIRVALSEYSKGVFLDLSLTPFEYSERATRKLWVEDALAAVAASRHTAKDVGSSLHCVTMKIASSARRLCSDHRFIESNFVPDSSQTQCVAAEILKQCLFLAGPTASGKTDISLVVAQRMGNLEIVSMDSMTLYRGMNIGTAKPSDSERQQVPHHLIDVIDAHEEFSVADYLAAVRTVCEQVVERGHRPLFVGGTGLYLRSVLRGVFEGPPADWSIRQRLEQQASDATNKGDGYWLMRQLEKIDPETALRLHPNDSRRLIRAIEVFEITGKPLSAQQQQPALSPDQRPQHVYWIDGPREWLHSRIDQRVKRMFEAGLLDEVKSLLVRPERISHTARQGLGYKELMDALQDNPQAELSPTEISAAIELIQTRTRQFAKRQCTWFRNLEECSVIEIKADETPQAIADNLANRFNG